MKFDSKDHVSTKFLLKDSELMLLCYNLNYYKLLKIIIFKYDFGSMV